MELNRTVARIVRGEEIREIVAEKFGVKKDDVHLNFAGRNVDEGTYITIAGYIRIKEVFDGTEYGGKEGPQVDS